MKTESKKVIPLPSHPFILQVKRFAARGATRQTLQCLHPPFSTGIYLNGSPQTIQNSKRDVSIPLAEPATLYSRC
jgi:hypothetical protein